MIIPLKALFYYITDRMMILLSQYIKLLLLLFIRCAVSFSGIVFFLARFAFSVFQFGRTSIPCYEKLELQTTSLLLLLFLL